LRFQRPKAIEVNRLPAFPQSYSFLLLLREITQTLLHRHRYVGALDPAFSASRLE